MSTPGLIDFRAIRQLRDKIIRCLRGYPRNTPGHSSDLHIDRMFQRSDALPFGRFFIGAFLTARLICLAGGQ